LELPSPNQYGLVETVVASAMTGPSATSTGASTRKTTESRELPPLTAALSISLHPSRTSPEVVAPLSPSPVNRIGTRHPPRSERL
jgi:hypothetical protein